MANHQQYPRTLIVFHWLTVLLLGANYIVSDGMGRALEQHIDGAATAGFVSNFHVYAGIAICLLIAFRLFARLVMTVPKPVGEPTSNLTRVSRFTHLGLYILMVGGPALGLIAWYGQIDQLGSLHALVINVLITLAGVHAAAALFHQFVLKDNLLKRMHW